MNELSHASLLLAAAISPEFEYSISWSGTPSLPAAALASSTVTPRGLPVAGSRVAQKAEAAGPTATATRRNPVGAISPAASAFAPRTLDATIIRLNARGPKARGNILLLHNLKRAAAYSMLGKIRKSDLAQGRPASTSRNNHSKV